MTRPDAERDARREVDAKQLAQMVLDAEDWLANVRYEPPSLALRLALLLADARAENERMANVIEKAQAWRHADCNGDGRCEDSHAPGCPMFESENALCEALAAPPAAPEPGLPQGVKP